jgi:small subunit ribosomal protein S11e
MVEVQDQKAYQKQRGITGVHSGSTSKKTPGKNGARWYKSVGLGFKTPKEAIEGNYIDKKCPFTGNVSIRGRILTGVVKSTKMKRTITIRRDYLHFIKKYQRFEKRHKMLSAHISPAFRTREGDTVTVGQCRPLSKTVRFNVLKVTPAAGGAGKGFGKF